MTELETLERAKMYMEKLANGINPIDDSIVSDEDIINNVRLSRCFFYVADILRRVIDNGGVSPAKKERREKKIPFSLSIEKRNDFEFSVQPIPISEITKRINALADENMARLPVRAIQEWLISVEILTEVLNDEGKNVKHPTPQGERMGISPENRIWEDRKYTVVVYNSDAQHFILDNLDAIVEYEHGRTENQRQPWLPSHDECLRDLYKSGASVTEISIALKRTGSSVRARLKMLNLIG